MVHDVRDTFRVFGSHRRGRHLGGRACHFVATCDVEPFEHVDVHVVLYAAPGLTRRVAALAAEDNVPSTAPLERDNSSAGDGQQRAAVLHKALWIIGRHFLALLRVNRIMIHFLHHFF